MDDTEKTTYCIYCKRDVPYVIRARTSECKIKRKTVQFEERAAFCKCCHKVVYVKGLEDFNVRSARQAYCKKAGLITSEKIVELQNKYGIGSKPLAELLGWGEITIIRFVNGCIPSKAYSDRLLDLMNNEKAFYDLVEKNKENIKQAAYDRLMARKKKTQTNPCIVSVQFDREKESYALGISDTQGGSGDNTHKIEVCQSTRISSLGVNREVMIEG